MLLPKYENLLTYSRVYLFIMLGCWVKVLSVNTFVYFEIMVRPILFDG